MFKKFNFFSLLKNILFLVLFSMIWPVLKVTKNVQAVGVNIVSQEFNEEQDWSVRPYLLTKEDFLTKIIAGVGWDFSEGIGGEVYWSFYQRNFSQFISIYKNRPAGWTESLSNLISQSKQQVVLHPCSAIYFITSFSKGIQYCTALNSLPGGLTPEETKKIMKHRLVFLFFTLGKFGGIMHNVFVGENLNINKVMFLNTVKFIQDFLSKAVTKTEDKDAFEKSVRAMLSNIWRDKNLGNEKVKYQIFKFIYDATNPHDSFTLLGNWLYKKVRYLEISELKKDGIIISEDYKKLSNKLREFGKKKERGTAAHYNYAAGYYYGDGLGVSSNDYVIHPCDFVYDDNTRVNCIFQGENEDSGEKKGEIIYYIAALEHYKRSFEREGYKYNIDLLQRTINSVNSLLEKLVIKIKTDDSLKNDDLFINANFKTGAVEDLEIKKGVFREISTRGKQGWLQSLKPWVTAAIAAVGDTIHIRSINLDLLVYEVDDFVGKYRTFSNALKEYGQGLWNRKGIDFYGNVDAVHPCDIIYNKNTRITCLLDKEQRGVVATAVVLAMIGHQKAAENGGKYTATIIKDTIRATNDFIKRIEDKRISKNSDDDIFGEDVKVSLSRAPSAVGYLEMNKAHAILFDWIYKKVKYLSLSDINSINIGVGDNYKKLSLGLKKHGKKINPVAPFPLYYGSFEEYKAEDVSISQRNYVIHPCDFIYDNKTQIKCELQKENRASNEEKKGEVIYYVIALDYYGRKYLGSKDTSYTADMLQKTIKSTNNLLEELILKVKNDSAFRTSSFFTSTDFDTVNTMTFPIEIKKGIFKEVYIRKGQGWSTLEAWITGVTSMIDDSAFSREQIITKQKFTQSPVKNLFKKGQINQKDKQPSAEVSKTNLVVHEKEIIEDLSSNQAIVATVEKDDDVRDTFSTSKIESLNKFTFMLSRDLIGSLFVHDNKEIKTGYMYTNGEFFLSGTYFLYKDFPLMGKVSLIESFEKKKKGGIVGSLLFRGNKKDLSFSVLYSLYCHSYDCLTLSSIKHGLGFKLSSQKFASFKIKTSVGELEISPFIGGLLVLDSSNGMLNTLLGADLRISLCKKHLCMILNSSNFIRIHPHREEDGVNSFFLSSILELDFLHAKYKQIEFGFIYTIIDLKDLFSLNNYDFGISFSVYL